MSERFDVAVIGCGVVGLAILRRFALSGLHCVALEKGPDILSGASKGNSALLHTGYDAPPKSLELQCMQAGRAEFLDLYGFHEMDRGQWTGGRRFTRRVLSIVHCTPNLAAAGFLWSHDNVPP